MQGMRKLSADDTETHIRSSPMQTSKVAISKLRFIRGANGPSLSILERDGRRFASPQDEILFDAVVEDPAGGLKRTT